MPQHIRDFVKPTSISFCANRNHWGLIEFNGASGVDGDTGPALQDAYYKVKHNFYNGNNEYTNDFELAWTKEHDYENQYTHETYGDFYPIIGTAMHVNTSWEGEDPWPYIAEVGEQVWWGSTFYPGRHEGSASSAGDLVRGALVNYVGSIKVNSTDGYSTESSYGPLYQGYGPDNNFLRWPSAGSQAEREGRSGWMATFVQEYAPQYDYLFYQAAIGNGNLCVPYQLYNGDPRSGKDSLWSPFSCSNNHYTEANPCYNEVDTNIPVIIWDYDYYLSNQSEINTVMRAYETDGDLSRFSTYVRAGNAVMSNQYVAPSVTENTKSFSCFCDIYIGQWIPGENETLNETLVGYRYLTAWVGPRRNIEEEPVLSLYKAPEGHTLKANFYLQGEIRQYRYSDDGGNSWTTVTKTGTEALTLPWDYMYYKLSDEPRGTYTYDKNHGGNMLLYENEEDARENNPWKAVDYKDKNQYYPTVNDTGTPELATTMGSTGMRSAFSTKYVLGFSDLVSLSNELFDSNGIIEDLKKGIEMLGSDPINAVQGLMYFPFDLANFFSLGTSQSIIIGGYTMQTANGKFMTSYNGYFEIGSIKILPSFPGEDYRNYEPYCNLNVFLPFIGLQSLKMNKYVDKTMSIRYYLDATNGACMACIFADGLLTDYFTGQVGVSLPITLTDYATYAGAAMQSIVSMAEGGANALVAVPQSDVAGAVEGLSQYETSLFNLSQTSINNFKTTKGTSSSLMNHFLPNYVYVIFEIVETDETSNLATLQGRRSNASGSINSFSGFLQTEWVNLSCGIATEEEKDEIQKYLASGIYI